MYITGLTFFKVGLMQVAMSEDVATDVWKETTFLFLHWQMSETLFVSKACKYLTCMMGIFCVCIYAHICDVLTVRVCAQCMWGLNGVYLYLYKDLSLCVYVHAWMCACGVNCVHERVLDVCACK